MLPAVEHNSGHSPGVYDERLSSRGSVGGDILVGGPRGRRDEAAVAQQGIAGDSGGHLAVACPTTPRGQVNPGIVPVILNPVVQDVKVGDPMGGPERRPTRNSGPTNVFLDRDNRITPDEEMIPPDRGVGDGLVRVQVRVITDFICIGLQQDAETTTPDGIAFGGQDGGRVGQGRADGGAVNEGAGAAGVEFDPSRVDVIVIEEKGVAGDGGVAYAPGAPRNPA